nr:unnamed protein product [Mus musculus]BAE42331.1 unnamed protein product [Mus musculus]
MAWEPTYLLSPVLLLLLASGSWTQNPVLLGVLEGDTISVTCWHDPLYNSDEKIWCKEIDNFCYPFVSKGVKEPRFSIQHTSRFNYFTLTMTKLKMSDSGNYYCGIATYTRIIYLRGIQLVVSKGRSSAPAIGTFPTLRAHTFRTTQDPISIAARGSVFSVIIPVVCGLLSKTLVFTVLFIVTQKSFGQQAMKAHNSNS